MQLVVVESPTKAKTLLGILGKDFVVKASMGHVRDLPKSGLGVDVDNDFKPEYVINEKSKKVLSELKKEAKKAQKVILATDPDREGEAIAWHLKELLELKGDQYGRAVFHEITKKAVLEAFENQGKINDNLVNAQQARRVLDRLVGYKLSPLLWKKVRYGLSAGRVQSVAVRLIVERELERQNFKPVEYWTIEGIFSNSQGKQFKALLLQKDDKKLQISNEEEAKLVLRELKGASFVVKDVRVTQKQKRPNPPFKTSTLQQSASNIFGFSAYRTMKAAQSLFEKGLITYHRTDSLNLSEAFMKEARLYISKNFSKDYLPPSAVFYKTSSKNAQEAHEAIRVTNVFLLPQEVINNLSSDESKLYSLIWQRSLQCQMSNAVYDVVGVDVVSDNGYLFRASGFVIKFDGWRVLSKESKEENAENEEGEKEGEGISGYLPDVSKDESLSVVSFLPSQHFTQPPARFTDATLVKTMEELGVGRPSTYAPTIQTIIARGYVEKEGKFFKPQDVSFVVINLLKEHFSDIVDYNFTASMEEELDEIALGKLKWQEVVRDFYGPFIKNLEIKDKELRKQDLTFLGESEEKCPKCGFKLIYKLGKYGRFLSCSNYPNCDFAKPAEEEKITSLFDDQANNQYFNQRFQNNADKEHEADVKSIDDEKIGNHSLSINNAYGKCEVCGEGEYVLKQGKFGKFLACSNYPKCKSTKPYLVKIGIKCPKCKEGEVVLRKAKGKNFYGCSRYPECDFSSWKKPV